MHETPAALTALHNNLSQALAQNKIAFDRQSTFRPHITLESNTPPPEELPFTPLTWHAGQGALVESKHRTEGIAYRVLALHSLHSDY